jgi:hypothetical protein
MPIPAPSKAILLVSEIATPIVLAGDCIVNCESVCV